MKLPFDHSYDFVFGLGQMCANAIYMSQYGLRAVSSPFDWLDGHLVAFSTCIDLVCHDFQGFLLRENLESLPNKMSALDDTRCDYYFDRGMKFRVMHDFPRGVPLDESYPQIMAKYRRRIDRLYTRVRQAKRTLFTYWSRFGTVPDDELREAVARLRAKFAGHAVDFLFIEHDASAVGIAKVVRLDDGLVRVVGRFYVPREDGQSIGDEELNGRVYRAIPQAFSMRLKRARYHLQRAAIRLVTAFCPVRSTRKAIRQRWLAALTARI